MAGVGRIVGGVLLALGLLGLLSWTPQALAHETTSGVVVEHVAALRDRVTNEPTGRYLVRVRYYPNGTETTTLAVPASKEPPGIGANVRLRYQPGDPDHPVLTSSLPLAHTLALTAGGLTVAGIALLWFGLRPLPVRSRPESPQDR